MYDKDTIEAARKLPDHAPFAFVDRIAQHRLNAYYARQEYQASNSDPQKRDRRLLNVERRERELERIYACRLALDFADSREWILARTDFGLATLARGGCWGAESPALVHDTFDHPYYFRRNRRAAAIAAHLYEGAFQANRARCEALAGRLGLTLELPDYPSWYYPGATTLVVYVGPAGR
jgi:hypothetical protein